MNLPTPLILTNFKTYESATGQRALELAQAHAAAAEQTGHSFAVAVQPTDLRMIATAVDIPVFAQHCDAVGFGSHTGWLLPEALREAGATGVILNHSEHRLLNHGEVARSVARAQEAGLIVCLCAEDAAEAAALDAACSPEFIAVEPPELIGGDISVSSAQPELIRAAVEQVVNSQVLVGAGVKNGDDVRIAKALGAVGVLLASGVTKAADPAAVLQDLVSQL